MVDYKAIEKILADLSEMGKEDYTHLDSLSVFAYSNVLSTKDSTNPTHKQKVKE